MCSPADDRERLRLVAEDAAVASGRPVSAGTQDRDRSRVVGRDPREHRPHLGCRAGVGRERGDGLRGVAAPAPVLDPSLLLNTDVAPPTPLPRLATTGEHPQVPLPTAPTADEMDFSGVMVDAPAPAPISVAKPLPTAPPADEMDFSGVMEEPPAPAPVSVAKPLPTAPPADEMDFSGVMEDAPAPAPAPPPTAQSGTTQTPAGAVHTSTAGPNATPLDPNAAAAATALLTPLAQQHIVAGAKPVGSAVAGQFQTGQSLTQQVQMQPGKCYTIVAAGARAPPADAKSRIAAAISSCAASVR